MGVKGQGGWVQYYARQQRGAGSAQSQQQLGQIYAGTRFGRGTMRGGGIGSFLGGVVRGISSLVGSAPSWLKTGAKLVGQSALRGAATYADDLRAGANKKTARKRAFKTAAADLAESTAKKLRGQGGKGKSKKKKRCCKLKRLQTGRGSACRKKSLLGRGSKKKKRKTTKKKKTKKIAPRKKSRGTYRKTIKGRTKFDLFNL
ncbi:MAG TPA: hypothetical protein VMZ26_09325 [Pyrinomonadaceae bacterium]|nr:hypothetical protein [Pyrinomonadaceae bacterium]